MDIADICSSPQLFAAYHVLLRLLVPRHSPYALSSLTFYEFLHIRQSFPKIFTSFSSLPYFSSIYFSMCYFEILCFCFVFLVVGSNGIEPSTSRLSGVRSNHLSYEPIFRVLVFSFHIIMSLTLFLMYYKKYIEK